MDRKGFTLIELVMVIVIIGILAAVAIPKFMSLKADAERAVCQSNVGAIRTALSNFYAKCNINASAVSGESVDSCFPNVTEVNYTASPSAGSFATDFFAEGNIPNNNTMKGTATNWGGAYSNTTGVINMTTCCGS
jgi:prepilin-type N-terminal cleavage/methylation domain-containing protein